MLKTSAVLFVLFLVLFALFPSNHYTAVDGALRCLRIFWNPALVFDENNHLLYPVWVLLWARLAEAIGIVAANAFEFIRLTQTMNALLTAASIATLYSVPYDLT